MSFASGQMLLHYRLLESIGKGGMGEVWAAEDTRLGRTVAIKLLPPEVADDPDRLARLEHEARAVAGLNHPNIVTVHAIEEAEGRHFIVMEQVGGRTLDELVPEKGLDTGAYFELAIPLAAAVAAAHEKGVVHRDLKPANVMVTDDGTIKVLDFGLARRTGGEQKDAPTATVTRPLSAPGTVLGTVPYMSPEQAQGRPVDHRSDIFSLGVMLYEMATGNRPYRGNSSAEVLSAILRDTPPQLSDVRPQLPPRLARIVGRCLEKDPRQRFQSALDLSNELADLRLESTSGGSIPAAPSRKRRMPWTAVVAVALVGIAAFAVVHWVDRDHQGPAAPAAEVAGQPMIVVFPFENLGPPEQDYFVAGVADEITSRLSTVDSLGVISRTSAVQYPRAGKTTAQIGEDLGVSYVLEGTVRWDPSSAGNRVRVTPQLVHVASDRQIWSESYDEQLDEIFAVQSEIAERVAAALDLTLGEGERRALQARPTENLEAYKLYLRGIDNSWRDYYSAENRLRSVELLEQAVALDAEFAVAWAELSAEHSYIYHLRYDTTEERRERARRTMERALELQPDLPEAHLAKGLYHYRCYRDYDEALAELQIAREGMPSSYRVVETVAAIRRRQGRWDEAIRNAVEATRLNPRDPIGLWDLGVTYMCVGRSEDAIRSCDLSIAVDPDQSAAHLIKAMAQRQQGNLAAARDTLEQVEDLENPFVSFMMLDQALLEGDFRQALVRAREFPADWFQGTVQAIPREAIEAYVLETEGRGDEARPLWEKSRELLAAELERVPDDARLHASMGAVLAYLGRDDEAIAEGRRAVELYPASLDAFHGPVHEADLARIYAIVGDQDAAIDILERLAETPSGVRPLSLALHPFWDPLRGNPRFEALAKRSD